MYSMARKLTSWERDNPWEASLAHGVGRAIARARRARRLSQDDLAERVELSRNSIANFELGRGLPRLSSLIAIAAALETPPLALLFHDITADIEILPGNHVPGYSALGWFIGAGGSVGIGQQYMYAPKGVETSDAMRIPLRLLQIDEALMQQRHSLLQSEGAVESGMFDNPAVEHQYKSQAEMTRRTIAALEEERERLLEVYRKTLDDE